jgi:hypothetical protein
VSERAKGASTGSKAKAESVAKKATGSKIARAGSVRQSEAGVLYWLQWHVDSGNLFFAATERAKNQEV